jgi:hypothetical protein
MSIIWKILILVVLALAVFSAVVCARALYLRSKCVDGQAPVKGTSY